jgi:hypothetical protein
MHCTETSAPEPGAVHVPFDVKVCVLTAVRPLLVGVDHVPLPVRKVVLLGVPVIAVRFAVPMLVSDAPEPEKSVA